MTVALTVFAARTLIALGVATALAAYAWDRITQDRP